ncbi:hypothetical protein A9Q77_02365 [Marinomonas sp. 42_23_T18]|nr:hypothetical protein A9Q77_02365 [Marinomonas sp. 42_23_T18]
MKDFFKQWLSNPYPLRTYYFQKKMDVRTGLIVGACVLASQAKAHTEDAFGNDIGDHGDQIHFVGEHPDYPGYEKVLICPDGELTASETSQLLNYLPTGAAINQQKQTLNSLMQSNLSDLGMVPDAPEVRDSLYELGRYLAFDKVLSGDRNIACLSCHQPNVFTGDERMLGFGTGGHATNGAKERGRIALGIDKDSPDTLADALLQIGTERTGDIENVAPRHSLPLYNLHMAKNLFWDGRLEYLETDFENIPETSLFYAETDAGVIRPVSKISLNDQDVYIFNEYRSGGSLVEPEWQDGVLFDSEASDDEASFVGEIETFIVGENAVYTLNTSDNTAISEIESVFEFGALSAQALFPSTNHIEMLGIDSGDYEYPMEGECSSTDQNELVAIATDSNNDLSLLWQGLVTRLKCEAPDYLALFSAAYNDVTGWDDVNGGHLANAIAGYMVREFESNQTPWQSFRERFISGESSDVIDDLTRAQVKGAIRFVETGCVDCHSGPVFSDFSFHNTGLPQMGPGRLDDPQGMLEFTTVSDLDAPNNGVNAYTGDLGRMHHDASAQAYTFRTSPLINVGETWTRGHAGQYLKLNDFIEHYRDPVTSYVNYRQCFEGPVTGQVGGVTSNGSDRYGFGAENGVGAEVQSMLWDPEGDGTPHTDGIIENIDEAVIALTQREDDGFEPLSRHDVYAISKFMNALTSREVCDNNWPIRKNGDRNTRNKPTNTDDPYYRYQQPAVSPPRVVRINEEGASDDGQTVLFNEGSVKDIPSIEMRNGSYRYIDLSHQISGLEIDWFYRQSCQSDSDQ